MLEGRYTWLEEGVLDPSGDGPTIAPQPEGVEEQGSNGNGSTPVAAAAAG